MIIQALQHDVQKMTTTTRWRVRKVNRNNNKNKRKTNIRFSFVLFLDVMSYLISYIHNFPSEESFSVTEAVTGSAVMTALAQFALPDHRNCGCSPGSSITNCNIKKRVCSLLTSLFLRFLRLLE